MTATPIPATKFVSDADRLRLPEPYASEYEAMRHEALLQYRQGNFADAATAVLNLINTSKASGHLEADDFILLATVLHAMKQHRASLEAMRECLKYKPDNLTVLRNYVTALQFNNEHEEAIRQIGVVIASGEAEFSDYDAMTSAMGDLGRFAEARHFGSMALRLRQQAFTEDNGWKPTAARKPFDPAAKKRNVIAFSLWGNQPRYIDSAIDNAMAAKYVYPSWSLRFYCDDSVPKAIRDRLVALGAEISMQHPNRSYEGLFWRFAVANDPEVDFFLIRDADAVVNTQERVAVDEWLASDRLFHLMRDYHTHSELILAGMWGGQANVLPNIIDMVNRYQSSELVTRTIDQTILRACIWPLIRHSVMMHDSQFDFGDGRPFPPYGRLPPGQHVGQSART